MRFVDTSFWVALLAADDRHPAAARELWSQRPVAVVTTNHVLGETWTFSRRRLGHRAARRFLDGAARSERLAVRHVEDEAWSWLRRQDEREYSFVDATSFALMRRLRLREALAFDGDFSAAGFVELRP